MVYKAPVMLLLQRHPSDRISMDSFDALCSKAFAGQSIDATARTDTNARGLTSEMWLPRQ